MHVKIRNREWINHALHCMVESVKYLGLEVTSYHRWIKCYSSLDNWKEGTTHLIIVVIKKKVNVGFSRDTSLTLTLHLWFSMLLKYINMVSLSPFPFKASKKALKFIFTCSSDSKNRVNKTLKFMYMHALVKLVTIDV